jgi:hypothetical protein
VPCCFPLFTGVYIPDTKNGVLGGLTLRGISGRQRLAKKTGARAPCMAKKPEMTLVAGI